MIRSAKAALTVCTTLIVACGSTEPPDRETLRAPLDVSALALTANAQSANGMSTNGMSTNGMSTNGLSTNGLSTNGLTAATLSSPLFALWFSLDPSFASMILGYVVKCSYASGKSLSYTWAGTTYTWPGELGLAPTWSSGGSIPLIEQQLVSACLAAHTNKFGVHVEVSVRGYLPNGSLVPMTSSELSAYTTDEGCFFGNLFDGSGVASAWSSATPMATVGKTSLRACAAYDGKPGSCLPMASANKTCQAICTSKYLDYRNYGVFQSCTWNGKSWPALTVKIAPADVATCGDGTCSPSETCYDKSTGAGCLADCGKCP